MKQATGCRVALQQRNSEHRRMLGDPSAYRTKRRCLSQVLPGPDPRSGESALRCADRQQFEALVCRRSGRRCARYPGSGPARRPSRRPMSTSPIGLTYGRASPTFGQSDRSSVRVAEGPSALSRKAANYSQPPSGDSRPRMTTPGVGRSPLEKKRHDANPDRSLPILFLQTPWEPPIVSLPTSPVHVRSPVAEGTDLGSHRRY
jgi:hypothetical protein